MAKRLGFEMERELEEAYEKLTRAAQHFFKQLPDMPLHDLSCCPEIEGLRQALRGVMHVRLKIAQAKAHKPKAVQE